MTGRANVCERVLRGEWCIIPLVQC